MAAGLNPEDSTASFRVTLHCDLAGVVGGGSRGALTLDGGVPLT